MTETELDRLPTIIPGSMHPALALATRRVQEPIPMKLLALGSPRSGTRYLTKCLRNVGFKVGHEGMKRDGTVGMFFAVEDVWYPGKHWTDHEGVEDESRQRRSDYRFEHVWHLVRDPRKVIASLASDWFPRFIWCWQERHTGISPGLYPAELRAMKFWVAWNDLIERNEKIALRIRLEDFESQWPEMLDRLGVEIQPIPEVPRDFGTYKENARYRESLSWDEMKAIDAEAASQVQEMAARYGYTDD